MKTNKSLGALLALTSGIVLATSANATTIFNETFEGYSLGDSNGQGGWVDFGGPRPANVVNSIANGGAQSLEFSTNPGYGSDSTLDLAAPITSGQLTLSFDIYQPSSFDGRSNVYLSRGPTLTGTFEEGLFFLGEGANFGDTGSPPTALLTDQWVAVLVDIDLDADTAVASYGGTEIFNGAWNNGGASPTQFQGINIWANNGAAVDSFYIDNLVLEQVPEPSGIALLVLGASGLILRRRVTRR